ncbi:hypothetical protein MMMB2_1869 [Mycobacterium marinum MB2]|nr:hypothetical protein MMMB2_1869 [Mycobacterium marinum MB2]
MCGVFALLRKLFVASAIHQAMSETPLAQVPVSVPEPKGGIVGRS